MIECFIKTNESFVLVYWFIVIIMTHMDVSLRGTKHLNKLIEILLSWFFLDHCCVEDTSFSNKPHQILYTFGMRPTEISQGAWSLSMHIVIFIASSDHSAEDTAFGSILCQIGKIMLRLGFTCHTHAIPLTQLWGCLLCRKFT